MRATLPPKEIPDVVLILGTDASGKDHVANILVAMIREAGGTVEKRARFLSGRPTREKDSSRKGWWDTLQERGFLLLFRALAAVMPLLVAAVVLWDLRRYRPPADKKLVVVGHNGLRALALHLGHSCPAPEKMRLPSYLSRTLERMREETRMQVIVLDVEDRVRKERIAARQAGGSEDVFDRYMRRDGRRSEHIEACLVRLAIGWLDGRLIENNDLSEKQLRQLLRDRFAGPA